MSDQPAPHPGTIWRENDPRKERYVRVVAGHGDRILIISVDKDTRAPLKGARVTEADLFRFGSFARGKYSFIEAPKSP